jgi:hypothetical protein
MKKVKLSPEEEHKAKLILQAMGKLERRRQAPRLATWIPWLITIALVVAIVVVLLTNREKFLSIWNHIFRPETLPGMD